jgi:aspartate aminotransferase
VRIAEGIAVFIEGVEKNHFKITPELLEKSITKQTKWVILNSPNNPSGSVYSKEEYSALGDVLKKHPHVYVLSDEIYEHIIYDQKFHSFAEACPDLYNRTLTVNGVSKAYAMTGWRIGYAGGPKDIIAAMKKIQSQSTSNTCSISQVAAQAALKGNQAFLQERNAEFEKRRNLIVKELNSIDGMTCVTPAGAFYVYPCCKGFIGKKTPSGAIIKSDTDFAEFLLDYAEIAVVPGSAFGYSPYLRISFATDIEQIKKALKRFKTACSSLT